MSGHLCWGWSTKGGAEGMKRIHQIAALCFIAFSAFFVWRSLDMEYYTDLGPGAGFFPLWLGAVLGGLGVVWLFQVSRRSEEPEKGVFFPQRGGILRILSIIPGLVTVSAFMDILGFPLVMFLFMLLMLMVLGRQPLWMTLLIALLCSVGVHHIFGRY